MKFTLILARLLDTFKAKNPRVFMVIVVVLTFIYAGVKKLIGEGIWLPPDFIANNLEYVGMVVALLLNAGTYDTKKDAGELPAA